MCEFVGFNIALPIAIHCFHPDCAAYVNFFMAVQCAMMFYMILSIINFFTEHQQCIWLKDVFTSIDRWVSLSISLSLYLSHTHAHTHAHTHMWDPLNYLFARDSF